MMYSEFATGTGCRDNPYNHKVFRDLEILYMHSDLTKEQIFEYGRKLVDNSRTAEEIETERRINADIEALKEEIKTLRKEAREYSELLRKETDPEWRKTWRARRDFYAEGARECRHKINSLKWILR